MHIDEPVDENGAHFLIDIALLGHVPGFWEEPSFVGSEAFEDFLGVWSDLLWDVAVAVVDVLHVVEGPKVDSGAVVDLTAVVLKDWLREDVPLFGSIASLGL